LIAALAVIAMLSNVGWLTRSVVRDFQEEVQATDRYVDMSVVLKVVRRNPLGTELIPGKPRVSVVGTSKPYGGVVDTRLEVPRILGDHKKNPTVWYVSEQQLPIVLHDSPLAGHLVEGGMGAGKTTCGVMWSYFRWLEHLGQFREGAIIAPTNDRLDVVFKEVFGLFPSHWYSYQSSTHMLTFCEGTRIRGVSTYKQSEAQGSRLQGQNWSWGFADEIQDQVNEFINFMARLRSGREGGAPRYASATAKDDPAYRDLKSKLVESGTWLTSRMLGPDSPFVHPDHWEAMRLITTDRDYRRLVLAEDLPSETRLYSSFDRKENIRPIPLGARKVTSVVLRSKTGNPQHALLFGNDPGTAKAGTVFLDAYSVRGEVWWWVRGELFTLHETTEQHAVKTLEIVRKQFGVNVRPGAEIAHGRAQPVGQAEDKPDQDLYRIYRRVGLDVAAAQFKKDGTGTGHIKKESRIGMLNTLFCNAAGHRRLFIECDDRGVPVAPLLVAALETMERDEKGRAEHEEKNVRHDKSDLPAALGYALWQFEREAATALRTEIKKGLG
jgi:hypothetical protein